MSQDWYQDIVDFHRIFGHYIKNRPSIPPMRVKNLRKHLIEEETEETLSALNKGDLVKLADGIADSIVVLLGTAVSYGIDMRPVWNLVHASNMAKLGGGKRIDGKSLKPEGWMSPNIEGELKRQGMED